MKSTYLSTLILNATLRGVSFTPPSTVYVALYTVAPTISGGGTEVSGGSYSRQLATFSAPSSQACTNSADVVFNIATANWGTIVAFALLDAPSGGNLLHFNTFGSPQTVLTNNQPKYTAGQLNVSET